MGIADGSQILVALNEAIYTLVFFLSSACWLPIYIVCRRLPRALPQSSFQSGLMIESATSTGVIVCILIPM